MHVPQVLASALLVLSQINDALALPATDAAESVDAASSTTSKCKNPIVRKEWRVFLPRFAPHI
jgi:hypothetical protein